jgi:cutinase
VVSRQRVHGHLEQLGGRHQLGNLTGRSPASILVIRRGTKYVSIDDVSAHRTARVLGAAVLTTLPLLNAAVGIPSSVANPCPDIEVVFARGTDQPPGVSVIGQGFVDALRPLVGRRSLGVYAVDYPASHDSGNSPSAGAKDASAHVKYMAVNCPGTRMVLGGYSQGAVVINLITGAGVPPPGFVPAPLPPEVADHVAAVAVFGNPWDKLPGLTATSPLYGGKAIDLCNPGDPVCSDGGDWMAHQLYVPWMVNQAAAFAASRL